LAQAKTKVRCAIASATEAMAMCPESVIFDLVAKTSLPQLVNPTGLAHLLVTARLALSELRLDNVWQRCLSTDFPRLTANSSCYELPHRRDMMSCYRFLHRVDRVILADGDWPIIRSGTEAKRLPSYCRAWRRVAPITTITWRLHPVFWWAASKCVNGMGIRSSIGFPQGSHCPVTCMQHSVDPIVRCLFDSLWLQILCWFRRVSARLRKMTNVPSMEI